MRTFICRTGAELLYCSAILVQAQFYFHALPVQDGEGLVWHLTVPEEALETLGTYYRGLEPGHLLQELRS